MPIHYYLLLPSRSGSSYKQMERVAGGSRFKFQQRQKNLTIKRTLLSFAVHVKIPFRINIEGKYIRFIYMQYKSQKKVPDKRHAHIIDTQMRIRK